MTEFEKNLGTLEVPDEIEKYFLFRPAFQISGCGVLFSLLVLCIGAGFLYWEIKTKLALGTPLLGILISPLSTFAFSLIFLAYSMIRNFLQMDLRPKNPHVFDPIGRRRVFLFKLLNWLNTIGSMLWIFTNQWSMDGYIWAFLGPVCFTMLMFGLATWSERESEFIKQSKYGQSMIHLNPVKATNRRTVLIEAQLYGDHLFKYCKSVDPNLFRIHEYYNSNDIPCQKLIASYHEEQIPLKGSQTIFEIKILKEHLQILDFDKKDGITYWLAEVKGDDKRYQAFFYPEVVCDWL